MTPAPCGCDREYKASRLEDPEIKKHQIEQAENLQREWRCPAAGHLPPESINELSGHCRAAHRIVTKLIDSELPPTCPMSELRRPWVREITDLLSLPEGFTHSLADLSMAQVEAMQCVRIGQQQRMEWERKHPMTEEQRRAEDADND